MSKPWNAQSEKVARNDESLSRSVLGGSKGSRQDEAREKVKAWILDGVLPAGAPLSEEVLAAELGMSRTPVRQALQELIAAGLAERLGVRGVAVSRIDFHRVLDIVEAQHCLLEWSVVRLCQQRVGAPDSAKACLDRQYEAVQSHDYSSLRKEARHMDVAIIAATRNRELERGIRAISDLLLHAATQSLSNEQQYRDALAEHRGIIDALDSLDASAARAAVQEHFEGVLHRLQSARNS